MKYFLSATFAFLAHLLIIAQVIPEERKVDWEVVPQHISIVQPVIQLNVKDFGAVGDGVTNDYLPVMDAIGSLGNSLGYVYFPPGNYLFREPITLGDSCILKGNGSGESVLLFDFDENPLNCISISKPQTTTFTEITAGANKGNNLITVSDVDNFSVGDFIEIRQKNGSWDVVPITWADYSVGQITKVIAIIGNKLLINSKLRIDYSTDLEPEVRPIVPISNSGIQCLKIVRKDEPTDGSGSNIYMDMAANCFVRGVESDTSAGAHISIYRSLNILVDGCYFHHSFQYDGVGMRGYGVALSQHASECLITNNIFRYLRHAMMIKTGANGNIFSYNYSLEPHRSEPIADASGDISFHGHYAFSNLWEGNIVQNIVIDHYWGPSGPYNTLFRNRAELWGIIMTTSNLLETNKQNFVGSEVTNTDLLHGQYTLSGDDHFEFGNNILGNIIPPGTNDLPDASYYLTAKPDFWGQFMDWPTIGIPYNLGSGTIPAKLRYQSGANFTVCPDSIITEIQSPEFNITQQLETWPVPADSKLNIKVNKGLSISELQLINKTGMIVFNHNYHFNNNSIVIDVSIFNPGLYTILVRTSNSVLTKKIIIVH